MVSKNAINCRLQALAYRIYSIKHRGFVPGGGGLILGVKKLLQNQAIALLIKIRFALTVFYGHFARNGHMGQKRFGEEEETVGQDKQRAQIIQKANILSFQAHFH